jgi:NAD(P)-dependent dehydrogenase (short-subunit alcohol dehydrogenase family)
MRTIIITGASGGIGRAVAERFLDAGWTVGLIARRAGLLDSIAAGRRAIALPCDVTQEDEVDHAFDAFHAETGRLDVLFNNAGIGAPRGPDRRHARCRSLAAGGGGQHHRRVPVRPQAAWKPDEGGRPRRAGASSTTARCPRQRPRPHGAVSYTMPPSTR